MGSGFKLLRSMLLVEHPERACAKLHQVDDPFDDLAVRNARALSVLRMD